MPTNSLVSGNVVQITLDADDYVTVANAQVFYPGGSSTVTTATQFGPYSGGGAVRIVAGASCTYTVTDATPATAPLMATPAQAAAFTGLVSGVWNPQPIASWRTIGSVTDSALAIGVGAYKTTDIQVPAPFGEVYGIRIVLGNLDTAASLLVDAVKIASAGVHLNSAASALTWVPVTFSGSASASVPAAGAVIGNQVQPGLLLSDLIPVRSIARSDGGSRKLFRVRALMSGGGSGRTVHTLQMGNAYAATWNADSRVNGYQVGHTTHSADYVTTTSDGNVVYEGATAHCPVFTVLFYGTSSGVHGVAVGDSLVQGQLSSAGNYLGWPQLATMRGNGDLTLANFGSSGQYMPDTLATLKRVVDTIKPGFVVMRNFTINGGAGAQSDFDTKFAMFLEGADYCRRNGIVFVGLTTTPVNSWSAGVAAMMATLNARTMALPQSPYFRVIDTATPVLDPANPSQILAAYNGDGTHLNDAGYYLQAQAFRAGMGLAS